MIAILSGFVAGLIHVTSGPDHLAAVAPLAAHGHRRAWASGLRWGLGHAAGVGVVGLAFVMLRGLIPIDLISAASERLVGVLLIGIAVWAFRKALQVHAHEHSHDGEKHVHVHIHGARRAHEHSGAHAAHTHAAFGIGTLHGLAGSSHFVGVLPALAFPSNTMAVEYLLAYGLGTVVAMIAFSSIIGSVAAHFAHRTTSAYRALMYACSAAAFSVGCAWLVM